MLPKYAIFPLKYEAGVEVNAMILVLSIIMTKLAKKSIGHSLSSQNYLFTILFSFKKIPFSLHRRPANRPEIPSDCSADGDLGAGYKHCTDIWNQGKMKMIIQSFYNILIFVLILETWISLDIPCSCALFRQLYVMIQTQTSTLTLTFFQDL